jgi:thiol:disulfide interchange protein
MASGDYGRIRVSDADRDSASAWLATAFVEGRLTKDEYDERLGLVLSAKTRAELATVTADLPGAVPSPPATGRVVPAATRTNPLAVASLVCGLCQVFFPPVLTVLAIVFGHVARGQIRRSSGRERGTGMATWGLVLGWLTIVVVVLAVGAGIAVSFSSSAPVLPTQAHPIRVVPPGG